MAIIKPPQVLRDLEGHSSCSDRDYKSTRSVAAFPPTAQIGRLVSPGAGNSYFLYPFLASCSPKPPYFHSCMPSSEIVFVEIVFLP